MHIVYSPAHLGHAGHMELDGGAILPGFEKPERALYILERAKAVGLGPVVAPSPHGLAVAERVHRPDYLAFLERAHAMWIEAGYSGTALAMAWPTRGLRDDVAPRHIRGLLGYYSFDGGAGFVAGTYAAIRAALDSALTGADLVADGAPVAFSLGRPPGHHAGSRFAGGYCYVNNAACAAESLIGRGAARVAILDVDYHHGNGTQEIFYGRSDVLFVSIHADPDVAYPYFLGRPDETGTGAGEGFTHNLPLPVGSGWDAWGAALGVAAERIAAFSPDAVVVSLGVDTYVGDPISKFRLETTDYPAIGRRIAKLGRPTLFVMEGGYAVEAIGVNAVGVLQGFLDGRSA
jgi:acetoin utilization deacetylase AcuC-like enzyme